MLSLKKHEPAPEKLSPPLFIQTPEVQPIVTPVPKMYAPKFDGTKASEFRRVNEADLVDLGKWLVPRLTEKYERASASGLLGWLQSVMSTNAYAFYRGPNSALLVERQTEPLEPMGVVRERFLRVRSLKTDTVEIRKAHYEEGLSLYRLAVEWSKGIKAARFEYGNDTDIPDANLYDVSANAKKKAYYSATL